MKRHADNRDTSPHDRTRSYFAPLAIGTLLAVALGASPVAAQASHTAEPGEELALELELASIESEADWAAGLWATATALHIAGVAGFIISFVQAVSDPCDGSAQCGWIDPMLATTAVSAAVGFLMFIPAITVDLHARSRRRSALEPEVRLHVAPARGGATLGVAGRF